MNHLESIAYGLARGFVRAWFDVQDERAKVVKEPVNEQDLDRARRFAASAAPGAGVRVGSPIPTRPPGSPPDYGVGPG